MSETYDPLASMQLSDSAYDDLLKDAEMDDRVGDHDFMVTSVVQDTWPSGDPRIKIAGVLTTARNSKADLTWSPPPTPDQVRAESKSWEPGKKRAIANAVSMARQLAKLYGKGFADVQEGETLRVKTVKTKRNDDGTGGFIRIAAVLPSGQGAAPTTGGAGF
jgi:hypothetical protein